MPKTSLHITIDNDLADFIRIYAQKNCTTASGLIAQFIRGLKQHGSQDSMDIIFSDPVFFQAFAEVQTRIRDGSAQWHSFDEVFGK